MVCPRCDGQGLIYRVKVLNLGIELNTCDECEACWPISFTMLIENFKDMTVFLEEHGLTYEGAEIKDLGYIGLENERRRNFFATPKNDIIALVDEAWLMKEGPLSHDQGAYVIDMKRIVGTKGESIIKIIVKPGTSEIRTAYPVEIKEIL